MNRIFAGCFMLITLTLTGCDSTTTPPAESKQAEQPPAPAAEAPTVQAPPLIDRTVLFGNPVRFQGRLSPDGSQLFYATYLGGSADDLVTTVVVDAPTGAVLVAGRTRSPDFPTTFSYHEPC